MFQPDKQDCMFADSLSVDRKLQDSEDVDMYGEHWFGGGFMWIFWLLLIIAIIWGVKATTSSGNDSANKQKSALDILKERYARGEIDQKEFEQKKKVLSNKL